MAKESRCEEMVLIVCESSLVGQVVEHLYSVGITHFTIQKEGLLGVGETGRHEGNPIWPGTNAIIFCCIPEEQVPGVVASLKEIHDSRQAHEVGLKIFSLPVRELL